MIKFSRNNLKYQNVWSPPNTLPMVMYTYTDILQLGIIALEHVIQKKKNGGFNGAFWRFGVLSEDQEKFLSNPPKLSCGFNPFSN